MGRISQTFKILRYLHKSIYFNFHYFPFRQAMKLPVLLYKPKFANLGGKVTINGPVSTGMVRLGFHSVSIYPNTGIIIDNNGGTIIFDGRAYVGSASAISIGEGATLHIGKRLMANAAIKIVCYHSITLGDDCRLAWETMMLDSDMHALTKSDGTLTKGYGPIEIGHDCWIGTGCTVLKNTCLPPYTTVQARSVLSRRYEIPEKSVIGPSHEIVIKATGTYRDLSNDRIDYTAHTRQNR